MFTYRSAGHQPRIPRTGRHADYAG